MGKKNKFKGFFGNIPRAKLNYFLNKYLKITVTNLLVKH